MEANMTNLINWKVLTMFGAIALVDLTLLAVSSVGAFSPHLNCMIKDEETNEYNNVTEIFESMCFWTFWIVLLNTLLQMYIKPFVLVKDIWFLENYYDIYQQRKSIFNYFSITNTITYLSFLCLYFSIRNLYYSPNMDQCSLSILTDEKILLFALLICVGLRLGLQFLSTVS